MYTKNPFNITKAVDFSDQQILDLWVDWPSNSGSGLTDLIKPNSAMPMFVIGGKGSGKTHLIRYFSIYLQKIRHSNDLLKGIMNDKYIGIYFRCGGLNPSRFKDKGISDDEWSVIFTYYIDLWFAYNTLTAIYSLNLVDDKLERIFCEKFLNLFDTNDGINILTFKSCIQYIEKLQKNLDYEVNNCVFTKSINVRIRSTRGNLIYGIPKVFTETYHDFFEILFLYLIDEFENFSIDQQKYFNTLLREKHGPCTFKIGSRLFGIKTHITYCDEEENKEGSEFEYLKLDEHYRSKIDDYSKFAKQIIISRFKASGYYFYDINFIDSLDFIFEHYDDNHFYSTTINMFLNTLSDHQHLKKFKTHLRSHLSRDSSEIIISNIQSSEFPLLEKAAINVIYKKWSLSDIELINLSKQLKIDIASSISSMKFSGLLEPSEHFKNDFLAQLFRENNTNYRYSGLSSIVDLSWGNPRHLIMILKHIFSWGLFRNEISSDKKLISIESQNKGIREASEWFFNDAKQIGVDGEHLQKCIDRICDLFRAIRYSSKPSECSICTFSVNMSDISVLAKKYIKIATQWSLIIEVGTHTDKNSGSKISKFQINRLLSPRWDIAIYRRGTIELDRHEIDVIFVKNDLDRYEEMKYKRICRMEPPFSCSKSTHPQLSLPI